MRAGRKYAGSHEALISKHGESHKYLTVWETDEWAIRYQRHRARFRSWAGRIRGELVFEALNILRFPRYDNLREIGMLSLRNAVGDMMKMRGNVSSILIAMRSSAYVERGE